MELSFVCRLTAEGREFVSWPAAIDRFSERVRHIEVSGTHLGMGFNPTIWQQIVSALESAPDEPC